MRVLWLTVNVCVCSMWFISLLFQDGQFTLYIECSKSLFPTEQAVLTRSSNAVHHEICHTGSSSQVAQPLLLLSLTALHSSSALFACDWGIQFCRSQDCSSDTVSYVIVLVVIFSNVPLNTFEIYFFINLLSMHTWAINSSTVYLVHSMYF